VTGYAVPVRYMVRSRRDETHDTVTLTLAPADEPIAQHRPGQFTMLSAAGIGEVPISVSGRPVGTDLVQTIRAVGAVTTALCAATPGQVIGVRGPFGTDWGIGGCSGQRLPDPVGRDILVLAGGIGMAPLRAAVLATLANRGRYGQVSVLVGSRAPAEITFRAEFESWRAAGADVRITVDRADAGWRGNVGVVTQLIGQVEIDPAATVALICGPEVMMRLTARALTGRGIAASDIRLSLERNMRCGIAECGHCQLGPVLLCRDGPVLDYQRARPLLAIKEL
jgi:anaerobic sulfite reductase subunit B